MLSINEDVRNRRLFRQFIQRILNGISFNYSEDIVRSEDPKSKPEINKKISTIS